MRSCPHCFSPYSAQIEFCGIDGTRLQHFDRDPLVGEELDRYHIIDTVGDGAMARVYRARHRVLEREYAVKVLFGEIASDKNLAERFRREAQVISKMNHPNIVAVVDFGTTPRGLTFLTMELVSGRTLREVIKREAPFPPERALPIATQIAEGLDEAHGRGFVHRDLKPGNVMLVDDGGLERVKILDFGLVRASDGDGDEGVLTRTGQFLGTPIYMSPEQIIGADVTPLADLYALGVVLFEMIEGRPPFKGKKLAEIRQKHLSEPPPAVRDSLGLETLIAALLEKDPARRPQSARDTIARLEAIAQVAHPFGASRPPTHTGKPPLPPTIDESMQTEVAAAPRIAADLQARVPTVEVIVPEGPLRGADPPPEQAAPPAAPGMSPPKPATTVSRPRAGLTSPWADKAIPSRADGDPNPSERSGPGASSRASMASSGPKSSKSTPKSPDVLPKEAHAALPAMAESPTLEPEPTDPESKEVARVAAAALAALPSEPSVTPIPAPIPPRPPAPEPAARPMEMKRLEVGESSVPPLLTSSIAIADLGESSDLSGRRVKSWPQSRALLVGTFAALALAAGAAGFSLLRYQDQTPVVIQPEEHPVEAALAVAQAVTAETMARAEANDPAIAAEAADEEIDENGVPSAAPGPEGRRAETRPAPIREHRPKTTIRELEIALTKELAHRGVTLEDLGHNPVIAPKVERWRAAHQAKNVALLLQAQAPLVSAVKTAPIDVATVRRRLDQVSDRLAKASDHVPVDKLRPFEDRYLELAKAVTPRTKDDEAPALLTKANALLREIVALGAH